MSFTKLLATGKSLVGMKDQDCPYRMRRENLLPKFESPKNPFAALAKTEPAPVEEIPIATIAPIEAIAVVNDQPKAMETSLLFDAHLNPVVKPEVVVVPVSEDRPAPAEAIAVKVVTKPASPVMELPVAKPAIAPAPAVTQQAKRNAPPVAPIPTVADVKSPAPAAWLKKLNPLTYFSARQTGAVVKSKPGRTPVQAELSLENVKVMRNDLSDADLEVVTAPAARKAASERGLTSLKSSEPTTLNRLTSRFFGAGQPQV